MENVNYFKAIINSLQEGIMIIDQGYHIVDANAVICSKYKKERRQLIGRPCYKIIHGFKDPCFLKGVECPVKTVFEKGRPAQTIHRHKLSEEQSAWEEIFASPLHDNDGKIHYVIKELRDITAVLKERQFLQQIKSKLKILEGIIAICANCKKIRNDKGYWEMVENYIRDHSEATCSHSLCPDCIKTIYPEFNFSMEQ